MSENKPIKPVSKLLESQVRASVRNGLRVWLDASGDYTAFVDALDDPGFPLVRWRSSYIEAILALEDVATGSDNRPALLHVPFHNKDSIRATPLFEFYEAGKLFEKNLSTLIQEAAAGLVTPTDIKAFLSSADVTLDAADAWLEQHAVIAQGGVDARLASMSSKPELLIDILYNPDEELVGALQSGSMNLEHLWGHLHRTFGLDEAWKRFAYIAPSGIDASRNMTTQCQAIGFTAVCWCLCVEYVDDLSKTRELFIDELKPLRNLATPLKQTALGVVAALRETREALYESVVDEFEPKLDRERTGGSAHELGKVDTFRFEQRRVMEAALEALGAGDFENVREWAAARKAEKSFWVRRDPARDAAWRLISHAADLGALLQTHPTPIKGAASLPEAIERYVEQGAGIDRAHRILEQRRSSLLDTRLPLYSKLRIQLDGLRRRYRKWADRLAIDFNRLCLDQGFRPTESLQQRNIFDQEVRQHALSLTPTTDPPVAFFMVDALRFEMAQELVDDLREDKESQVELTLQPRFAELPTITAVGMNALAPVTQNGLLHPILEKGAFMGFRAREFQVTRPPDRQKAMRHRVGGRTSPEVTLREVLDDDVTRLRRRIAEASLLIVKSRELDESGEKGLGPATFEATLRDLRAAVQLLREAGVEHFVFSADHGFLLLDQTAARDALQQGGKQTGVDRRHLFYPVNSREDGRVTVSLSELGYADAEGFLMLPEDTSIFDRGARNQLFVHGGNSLQERVIPVLHARFKSGQQKARARFKLTVSEAEGIMGLHALEVFVEQNNEQGLLRLPGMDRLDLALRPATLDLENAPRIEVELADVRGAELRGGVIRAPLGAAVEVFFKLTSDIEVPKIEVEVYAPTRRTDEVKPERSKTRFSVTHTVTKTARVQPDLAPPSAPTTPEVPDASAEVSTPDPTAETPTAHEAEAASETPSASPHLEAAETADGGASDLPVIEETSAEIGDVGSDIIEYGGWEDLPQDGTQQIFEHIARFGSITEAEARAKLGSGRQFRRFSRKIDEYISHVSFDVRVEMAGGTKRYVLEKG